MIDLEKEIQSQIDAAQNEQPLIRAKKLNDLLSSLADCVNICDSHLNLLAPGLQEELALAPKEKLSAEFLEDLQKETLGFVNMPQRQDRVRSKIVN